LPPSLPQYVRAEINLDEYFLRLLPALASFLNTPEAIAWEETGILSVHYQHGVRPNLQLFAAGQTTPGEIVSISQWTAESLKEFLLDNLHEEDDEEEATRPGKRARDEL
ncbi:selenoprotein-like protein, partial [Nannochloropsis gaditana]